LYLVVSRTGESLYSKGFRLLSRENPGNFLSTENVSAYGMPLVWRSCPSKHDHGAISTSTTGSSQLFLHIHGGKINGISNMQKFWQKCGVVEAVDTVLNLPVRLNPVTRDRTPQFGLRSTP
jgi:hypothetical protein